jgi:hypothetical protein
MPTPFESFARLCPTAFSPYRGIIGLKFERQFKYRDESNLNDLKSAAVRNDSSITNMPAGQAFSAHEDDLLTLRLGISITTPESVCG